MPPAKPIKLVLGRNNKINRVKTTGLDLNVESVQLPKQPKYRLVRNPSPEKPLNSDIVELLGEDDEVNIRM